MKRIVPLLHLVVLITLAMLIPTTSPAYPLVYDGFTGDVGAEPPHYLYNQTDTLGGTFASTGFGANKWNNLPGNNALNEVVGSLTYTDSHGNTLYSSGDSVTDGNNNRAFRNIDTSSLLFAGFTNGSGSSQNIGYNGTSPTIVYLSWVEQSNQTGGNPYYGLELHTSQNSADSSKILDFEPGGIRVSNATLTAYSTAPTMTNVNFFVAKLTFNGSGNDSVTLYDNPILGDPLSNPIATVSNLNINFNQIGFGNFSNPSLVASFGDIRLGSSLSDVEPFAAVPEPSTWALLIAALLVMVMLRRGDIRTVYQNKFEALERP